MLLTFLLLAISTNIILAQEDCWWTGCQLDSWAVKGCAQYDRYEKARRGCNGGNEYQCCKRSDGGGDTGGGDGGSASEITWDQFRNAVTSNPAGEGWKWPAPSQDQFNKFKAGITSRGSISTKREAAMALANLLQESDGLTAKEEIRCRDNGGCPGEYIDNRCQVGNNRYFGRGYIQLTWCYNYRDASRGLFNDDRLLNDPGMVARSEELSWNTAFWYWREKVHNYQGVQQGQFGSTIKAINGGLECPGPNQTDDGRRQAERRKRIYNAVRQAFNLQGQGDMRGC